MPDPVIPADECKATCNWRNSFSGNTFKKNPYTFGEIHIVYRAFYAISDISNCCRLHRNSTVL